MPDSNKNKRQTVLIADDDAAIRRLLKITVEKIGLIAVMANDGREAMDLINDEVVAALIDLNMPRAGGLEVLQFIKEKHPSIPVVMVSGAAEVKDAVAAMKYGAFDYLTKPFDTEGLLSVLQPAVHLGRTTREVELLRNAVSESMPTSKFVGTSEVATKILKQAETIARLSSTVLITGESGCGKGLLARLIHQASPRASKPFVAVSCPSIPRDLLESELFGHEKGAFTGAIQQRIGRAEMADGGTLFLDEIGDLPLALQPKLLTFLQERVFQRVGGSETLETDVRVIAATNHDLVDKVHRKEFREDLYFRLNVLPIRIPPLRERRSDIPGMVVQILAQIATARKTPAFVVAPETMSALQLYNWPGNVRELENILERASAFCTNGIIKPDDLASEVLRQPGQSSMGFSLKLPEIPLEDLERLAIEQMLERCRGNKAEAARRLGITEKTIYNKLARFGVK